MLLSLLLLLTRARLQGAAEKRFTVISNNRQDLRPPFSYIFIAHKLSFSLTHNGIYARCNHLLSSFVTLKKVCHRQSTSHDDQSGDKYNDGKPSDAVNECSDYETTIREKDVLIDELQRKCQQLEAFGRGWMPFNQ